MGKIKLYHNKINRTFEFHSESAILNITEELLGKVATKRLDIISEE
jgi:hypothetical protein